MNTIAKPQTKLTLIRGNLFPGGAMNTEIIQAAEAVNTVGIRNIITVLRNKIANSFRKLWPINEVELNILQSLKTNDWELSFTDSIKHGALTRGGLKICFAPTNLSFLAYKGWYVYNISINSVAIRIKNGKIMAYIVDNILPDDKILWGLPNEEAVLAAVRKTLA